MPTNLKTMILKNLVIALSVLMLAACASAPKGVRISNNGSSATTDKQGAAIRNLSSAEITQVVVGKSFQFTRSDSTGFVIYNADGTLDITDDKKGALKGKWSTTGDQYCETYASGAQECGVFK
ncbi:MAG: hypothetical protein KGO94_11465, partial [Alphaproteobacteria bacterium]|nr:hypothetical protein [Alphaproteobacteria bacterium]